MDTSEFTVCGILSGELLSDTTVMLCFHNILFNFLTLNIYCEAFYATDGSQQECVHSWAAHTGDVYTVVFSPDLSSVYSMGADGKVHSLHRSLTGKNLYASFVGK